jgi:hypothetical protein
MRAITLPEVTPDSHGPLRDNGKVCAPFQIARWSNANPKEDYVMKRSLINGIACAGLLLFSLSARQAVAQDRDNDRDNDSFYHSREGFYSGDS